jgi:hypothetical protein
MFVEQGLVNNENRLDEIRTLDEEIAANANGITRQTLAGGLCSVKIDRVSVDVDCI